MVEWLFSEVPWDCLRFVIVVFPDYTHILFFIISDTGKPGQGNVLHIFHASELTVVSTLHLMVIFHPFSGE